MKVLYVTEFLYEDVFMLEDGNIVHIGPMQFKQPTTEEQVIKLALIHSHVFNYPVSERLQFLLTKVLQNVSPDDTPAELLDLHYNLSPELISEEFNGFHTEPQHGSKLDLAFKAISNVWDGDKNDLENLNNINAKLEELKC